MSENSESVRAAESNMANFRHRTLQNAGQPLIPYLSGRHRVLDAGCGEGRITLDVAESVKPGIVIGIDAVENNVEESSKKQRRAAANNLRFMAADAYAMPFPDDYFDLCYSNGLMEWLRQPERSLSEQIRVTRPGGHVVSMTASMADAIHYPECPTIDRLLIWMRWTPNDSFDAQSDDFFHNGWSGRKIFGLYTEAGLHDIHLQPYYPEDNIAYRGSTYFEYRVIFSPQWFNPEDPAPWLKKGLADGSVSTEELRQAWDEAQIWCTHPHALYINYRMFIAGSVG